MCAGAVGGLLFAHLPPVEESTVFPEAPSAMRSSVYEVACMQCHGVNGAGRSPWVLPFSAARMRRSDTLDWSVAVILHGCSIRDAGAPGGMRVMPGMGSWLSDEEIAEALNYLRVRLAGAAESVSPAEVATVRRRYAGRAQPWSPPEFQRVVLSNPVAPIAAHP